MKGNLQMFSRCSECGEPCKVIILKNEFTIDSPRGSVIYYPSDYGTLVSDCCEAPIMKGGKNGRNED